MEPWRAVDSHIGGLEAQNRALWSQISVISKRSRIQIRIHIVVGSVADPGCLSRIRLFSIPDPNCLHPGSRILKEFKYFNPKKSKKMVSKLLKM